MKKTLKRIIILGSTGSIGLQALDIVRNKPDLFSVAAISCHSSTDKLARQIEKFKPEAIAVTDDQSVFSVDPPRRLYRGSKGICAMIRETDADIVLNGIAGAPGLLPSFAAVESGKNLALANKETIVMAGELILAKAEANRVLIIPVDSEHSAIFHLLAGVRRPFLEEIILTASGGAFRDYSIEALKNVTVKDALRHPNWTMGEKITVDSATMANKALEVIEAHHLFSLPVGKIKVVIHPQSYVHSLIRTIDGSLYAQLSKPDMRIPIQNALTYPDLVDVGYGKLDITGATLEFSPVPKEKYPLLALGYHAASAGGALPIVFNAANEIAVSEFIAGRISFLDISRIVSSCLEREWRNLNSTLDDVILIDNQARKTAREIIGKAR